MSKILISWTLTNILFFTFLLTAQGKILPSHLYDAVHGVKMGFSDPRCDDAKFGTQIDWDESPVNYTCYTPKEPFEIQYLHPIESCVKTDDHPKHKCMDVAIVYSDPIPTSGTHRPLWPVFGEYLFVPPQRWIHSLEHGAVVMLYHPCAHPQLVSRLRSLVTTCIRKHVITPYTQLSEERPLALVTWGCKMEMNQFDDTSVIRFIRETAMRAPEAKVSKDGQYDKYLIVKAEPVFGSDLKDSNLCPLFPAYI